MKTNKLLSLVLGAAVVLAACNQSDSKPKTETKTEQKSESKSTKTTNSSKENKDAVAIINKAKEAGKSVESYKSVVTSNYKQNKQNQKSTSNITVSKDGNIALENVIAGQKNAQYLIKDQLIVSKDNEYFDATKVAGKKGIEQLQQLKYQDTLSTLEAFKSADVKKTADGYELSVTFKDKDAFIEFSKSTGQQQTINQIVKNFDKVSGKNTLFFDKDYHLIKVQSDTTMEGKKASIHSDLTQENTDFNKVDKIDVPKGAENPKDYEAEMKKQAEKLKSQQE